MNPISFALVLTGVLLNAAAQLLLKAATQAVGPLQLHWQWFWQTGLDMRFLGGLGCYAVSVVVWVMALSNVAVSIAYPMLSIGYVVNLFLAHWLFGEPITVMKFAGIGFILVGVALLYRS